MLIFRILHKQFHDPLFAPGIPGRWNRAGKKVLYCSESIPLAFMESMVRRQGVGFNNDFQVAHIEIPDSAAIKSIELADLKNGWDNPHDYFMCQALTDNWFDNRESLILKVPSATLNVCSNYVINTLHPDFKSIKLIGLTPLAPDPRIDEILKKGK